MGAIVLCMHWDSEMQCGSTANHEAESKDRCCHHDTDHAAIADVEDCNACFDTEIELDELGEANPKAGRLSAKAPNSVEVASIDFDELVPANAVDRVRLVPVRGPPDRLSATLALVKTTVLRI